MFLDKQTTDIKRYFKKVLNELKMVELIDLTKFPFVRGFDYP